jgi:hypothetical protein
MSEPWSINRWIAIGVALVVAILFGSWAANAEYEYLALFSVWFVAAGVIVFVQDYWWAPVLVIGAFGLSTNVGGIPLSGLELGLAILCLTLPTKMAMKTLRKAEPVINPGFFFWLLFAYLLIHAVVIIAYNHTMGVQLKNIVKAYYGAIVPLVFFGLVIRYCHLRTVGPTIVTLFATIFFTTCMAIIVFITGYAVDFGDLHISISWLTALGAVSILRYNALYLFIFCFAYWPAARSNIVRICLGIAIAVSGFAVLLGGGRLSAATAMLAGVFFAIIRGKLWLALPFIIFTLGAATLVTFYPDALNSMPGTIQRALAPLNISSEQSQVQEDLTASDDWHRDLRNRSYDYWLTDINSFYFGHGYKSWDPTIDLTNADGMSEADQERLQELAIEMGLTENMFSSVTNIFGIVGIILYLCFLVQLWWTLFRGIRRSPSGTMARALCEFSLVLLTTQLLFMFIMGSAPGIWLIYWAIGVPAARLYLTGKTAGAPESREAVLPAFARPAYSGQGVLSPPGRPARRPV